MSNEHAEKSGELTPAQISKGGLIGGFVMTVISAAYMIKGGNYGVQFAADAGVVIGPMCMFVGSAFAFYREGDFERPGPNSVVPPDLPKGPAAEEVYDPSVYVRPPDLVEMDQERLREGL